MGLADLLAAARHTPSLLRGQYRIVLVRKQS